jgi:ABC-type nitrate/sulfonate/bicarbonate transport system substrate-binding protein
LEFNGENQFSLRVYRALGAGLALVGMALIGAQPAAALDKLTVGIIPITDYAPIFLGKQKGFFAKHNLDVNIESACRVRWSARKC